MSRGAPGEKRARILDAARTLLTRDGLDKWSTERVARAAGCAKGLVHYHFRGRGALLAEVARALTRDTAERRGRELEGTGTAALDRLWKELEREASSGQLAARLTLSGVSDEKVRAALEPTADQLAALGAAIGRVLAISDVTSAEARCTWATMDGLGAALMTGAPKDAIHEGFDRWWLTLLPA